VIAISSVDRDTGCWSWNEDGWDVAELLKGFLRDWGCAQLWLIFSVKPLFRYLVM